MVGNFITYCNIFFRFIKRNQNQPKAILKLNSSMYDLPHSQQQKQFTMGMFSAKIIQDDTITDGGYKSDIVIYWEKIDQIIETRIVPRNPLCPARPYTSHSSEGKEVLFLFELPTNLLLNIINAFIYFNCCYLFSCYNI